MKRCPHCGVSRDTFADEGSWLSHVQHEARMARAERVRQVAAKRPQPKREQKQPLTRSERVLQRMKYREYARKWRSLNPEKPLEYGRRYRERHLERTREASRRWRAKIRANPVRYEYLRLYRAAYHQDHAEQEREYNRRWGLAHPEKKREHARLTRLRHLERYRERDRQYGRAHRAQKLAYMRERYLKTHPDAPTRVEVIRDARLLGQKVMELRARGVLWQEIAVQLARTVKSCKMLCQHERKRQTIAPYQEARQFAEQVIEARSLGFSWSEIAALLERPMGTCSSAYYAAMKRRQANQDSQCC